MKHKLRNNKGFTLIELMVAMGILAMVMALASIVFRVSINAHRTALANAEIMQKVRAITDQLNADFKGLNKDSEIFMAWVARPVAPGGRKDNDSDGYERFDRVVFFADGDFQSHGGSPTIRGNTARICYMLAKRPAAVPGQPPTKVDGQKADSQWYEWNNRYEYDKLSLEQWKQIPFDSKKNMLSVITGIKFDVPTVVEDFWGCSIDPADPDSIHMLLCDGVAEFKIQSWYDAEQRWIPEVDPDRDGSLADTDFIMAPSGGALDLEAVPGVLYPYPPHGGVRIHNISYPRDQVDKAHFNEIPGLGRALKFTFTLYDSNGILKEGRTFTHIVYLDK